jgi:Rieske Fe-S protein
MNDAHPSPPPPERRTFLKWLTHGLGALFGVVLGVPAVLYLIDPRNRPAAGGDFKTVARLSELEKDVPRQAVVRDVRRDAWTLHPNDVVGRVWLIRRDDKKVEAFTTVCPHLGCSVNYEDKTRQFICPCHNAIYDLQGKKVNDVAPRGMDALECRIVKDSANKDSANEDLIQVEYRNFIQGLPNPVPKA